LVAINSQDKIEIKDILMNKENIFLGLDYSEADEDRKSPAVGTYNIKLG